MSNLAVVIGLAVFIIVIGFIIDHFKPTTIKYRGYRFDNEGRGEE